MKQKIDEIWMKRTKSFREFSDRKMTIKNQFISSQKLLSGSLSFGIVF